MPGPGYLLVALKILGRDSSYLENELRGLAVQSGLAVPVTRDGRRIVRGVCDLLQGAVAGVHGADLWVGVPGTNAVAGTRTVTCTQATSAGNAVTFACGTLSIALTEGVEFAAGASDTTEATALAAAINANAVLKTLFTTTSATNVVTIVNKFPGRLMDDWTITGSTGLVVATTVTGTEGTAKIPLRNVLLNHTP